MPEKKAAKKPARKTRIKKQAERKHEAQADLKNITESHAPPSAQDERKGLIGAIKKVIASAQKRLDTLRTRHHKNHRAAIIAFCKWGVANTAQIHYAQIRPMNLAGAKARSLPLTTDCSGFATMAYYVAGAPDPNGYNYNGQGYTGTMLSHCQHISQSAAKKGDLVVFGNAPGTHVVVLAEDPTDAYDPLCYSHGQEAGPIEVRLSVEQSAHPGQSVNFLRAL